MVYERICAELGKDPLQNLFIPGLSEEHTEQRRRELSALMEHNFTYLETHRKELFETLFHGEYKKDASLILITPNVDKKLEICDLLSITGNARILLLESYSFNGLISRNFNIQMLEFFVEQLGKETVYNIITLGGIENHNEYFMDLEKNMEAEKVRNQLMQLCCIESVPAGRMSSLFSLDEYTTESSKRQISFVGSCIREIRYMVEVCNIPLQQLIANHTKEEIVQYAGVIRSLSNQYANITKNNKEVIDFDYGFKKCPFSLDKILHIYSVMGHFKKYDLSREDCKKFVHFLHQYKSISDEQKDILLTSISINLTDKTLPEKHILAKLPFNQPLGSISASAASDYVHIQSYHKSIPQELGYSKQLYDTYIKMQEYMIYNTTYKNDIQKIRHQLGKWSLDQQESFFNLTKLLSFEQLDLFFMYRKEQPNNKRRDTIKDFYHTLYLINTADKTLQQCTKGNQLTPESQERLYRFVVEYGVDGSGQISLPTISEDRVDIITNLLSQCAQSPATPLVEVAKTLEKYYLETLSGEIDKLLHIQHISHRDFMVGEYKILYELFVEIKKSTPDIRARIGLIMQIYMRGKRDEVRSNITTIPLEDYITTEGSEILEKAEVMNPHRTQREIGEGRIEVDIVTAEGNTKEVDKTLFRSFNIPGIENNHRQYFQKTASYTRSISPLTYEQQRFNIKSGFEELRDPDIYDEHIREDIKEIKHTTQNFASFVREITKIIPYEKLKRIMPVIDFADRIDYIIKYGIPTGDITEAQHNEHSKKAQDLFIEIYKSFTENSHIPGMIRCEEYANHLGLIFDEGDVSYLQTSAIRESIETKSILTNDLVSVLKHMRGCIGLKGGKVDVNLDYLLPHRFFVYSQDTNTSDISIADQIIVILPSEEYGPIYVFDTLYGLRNKDILLNHIMTVSNHAKEVKKYCSIPLFIPYSTITSAGTTEKEFLETLKKHIPEENYTSTITPTIDLTYAGYKEFNEMKGGILITI